MTGPEQDRLDEMIEQGLGDIVPGEGVVGEVNPWREPIGRIAAGMALTGITLNFLYLQYLLPTLGAALQYLGFRTLRRSGPAFRIAWGLSLVELVWHAVWLMLSASPWRLEGMTAYTLGLAGMAVQIARLLLLRAGLRDVCRRAEVEPQGDPLRAAVIWQVLIAVLAFSPLAQSWLAAIPMIIAFVLIIQSLERVGGSLGGAGYCFVDAPVRVESTGTPYSGALRATITGPDASRTALAIATEDGDVGSVPVSVGAGQGVDRTLALRTAGPLTPGNHELVISVEDEDGWIRELAVFGLNVAADGSLPMGSGALGSASLGSLGG